MRVNLVPVFHVNLKICEFFNIDLDERGYCQIRVSPKQNPEFTTTFDFNEHQMQIQQPARTSRDESAGILPMCIENNIGVSRTFEITFVDEKIKIEDLFKLSVQIQSTDDVCTVKYLFVDIEVWYMDRYRPPNMKLFVKLSSRTIRIPLDPTRMIGAARSLYFDTSAITMRCFSSLTKIETQFKKTPPENHQIRSIRAKNTHSAAIHALLYSKRSIEMFIAKYSELTHVIVRPPKVSDIQKEMKLTREALEQDPSPYQRLKLDILRFSTTLEFIHSQLLELFEDSKKLTIQLLTIYDKQRRNILREAFFYQERLLGDIRLNGFLDRNELCSIVLRSNYLKKLPKTTLFCAETDCPGDVCSVIFEETYTRLPSQSDGLVLSESMSELGPSTSRSSGVMTKPIISPRPYVYTRRTKSFRHRASEKLYSMKPRRRSVDHKSPTHFLKTTPPPLSFTRSNLFEIQPYKKKEDQEGTSEMARCSAAGNQEEKEKEEEDQVMTLTVVSPEETVAALSTSKSLDQIDRIKRKDEIQEDHPQDMMDCFEFLQQKEVVKGKLVNEMSYDGYLYSEKSNLGVTIPTFTPLTSSYIEAKKEGSMNEVLKKPVMMHLVVFVHGLEGSPEDLVAYKNCIRRIIDSHYNAHHNDNDNSQSWKFEYMMSKSNLDSTWHAFKEMSANLLDEVLNKLDQNSVEYDRISFVGHSLGGLIIRDMIGMEDDMKEMINRKLLSKLYTFLTINTPHMGLAYNTKHVNIGVTVVKWFKRSTSIEQMSFKDASNVEDGFIYKLSKNGALSKFVNVLVLGNPHDLIVPHNSAVILPNKQSSKDSSSFGNHYKQIINNLIDSIQNSDRLENFVRYSSVHQISTARANHFMGRAAHIAAVEDLVFVEKFLSISAIKYFM